MGIVMFNGQSSKDVYAEVEEPPTYSVPKRNYNQTHIPGRNGDLIEDEGSYDNVDATYKMSVVPPKGYTYSSVMSLFSSWLNSSSGYARLEDTYDVEHYRIASFEGPLDISNVFEKGGKVELKFSCQPFRFLKAGEEPISLQNGKNVVVNPTSFKSKPFIYISGSGSGYFKINDITVTIASIYDGMIIDSDNYDCYKLGANDSYVNLNSAIVVDPVDSFPEFNGGRNVVTVAGGIKDIVVIPRWCTL